MSIPKFEVSNLRYPISRSHARASRVVVRAWDDLDGGDLSEGRGGGSGGVEAAFTAATSPVKNPVTRPEPIFLPAGHLDVRGLEGGVGGFRRETRPLVSRMPIACLAIFVRSYWFRVIREFRRFRIARAVPDVGGQ